MSLRKNQNFLSEQEKNDLIEEYKHTPISQQKLAEKFDVSKTQVQKVIDHSGAIKMVKRVKKTPNKEQDVDFMSRRAMVRQDIQEFNSFSELAHFADVGKTTDLVFQTHREYFCHNQERDIFEMNIPHNMQVVLRSMEKQHFDYELIRSITVIRFQ